MTEAEWNACTDPQKMLEFLHRKKSQRKKRLFACACCRLIWDKIPTALQLTVEISESCADGAADKGKLLRSVYRLAGAQAGDVYARSTAVWACTRSQSWHRSALGAARHAANVMERGRPSLRAKHMLLQANALRDIFHPFHRLIVDPLWLTSPVQRLAESIYTDRSFAHLPILADALEDAGCTNADILNHCRQPGDHVRGCWVVDLLLGKE